MTRGQLEARIAETLQIFLAVDDWLKALPEDPVVDDRVTERCLQAHSALAGLYRLWTARLKQSEGHGGR